MIEGTRQHRHNVPSARELRKRETPEEDILWTALKGRRLNGLKFRRQHPVGPFVVDFCCVDRRLAIELDGEVHASQIDRDAEREEPLATTGLRILRFANDAVRNDLPRVLGTIIASADEAPTPRPQGPGRAAGWS